MTASLESDPVPADTPDFPEPRSAGCPFGLSPQMRGLAAFGPVFRARTWDGMTPWVVTGHAEQKTLLSAPTSPRRSLIRGITAATALASHIRPCCAASRPSARRPAWTTSPSSTTR
ncbi:hypothetical protein ABT065_12835 [Streptomyces sp. NPDC002764]|uniref:hypothetical protein n=1 Tax=unclassified Streptomyces TaxID=2593676 RepID=UPI00332D7954